MENTMWLQVAALIFGNLSFIVPLFLWNRSEANADRRDLVNVVRGIQEEMKDFHGRLERQDAEFKAHLMNSHK
jgi:hypothetical protein